MNHATTDLPPVMFTSRPFADLIVSSPRSGFVSASSAALIALSSPSACPDPMIAFPVDFITLQPCRVRESPWRVKPRLDELC